jgi:hypothetical protein
MLVRSQLGPVQNRVRGSPFSHALIGGDPNPLGSGPRHHMPIRGMHPKDDHRPDKKSWTGLIS